MSNKILTIGVAAYNVEKTIESCIISMLNSKVNNDIEILVVNDGSTDNTAKVVQQFVNKYPDTVKLINKKNGGHGSTINSAVKYATGKYFKMVDGDDSLEKKGLCSLLKKLKENTTVDIIFSPYFTVDINTGDKKKIGYLKGTDKMYLNNVNTSLKSFYKNLFVAMHGITYRTSLLKNSKYHIDEHCFYVDVEYTIYYLINARKILLLDEPVYDYSIGSSTQSIDAKVKIKRRDQHLHVCKSLVSFYEAEKNNVPNYIADMIKKNIVNMILCNEYTLLMSLPSTRDSYKEIREFDTYLKEKSLDLYNPNLYTGIRGLNSGKKLALLRFWKKNNFIGYKIIHSMLLNRIDK